MASVKFVKKVIGSAVWDYWVGICIVLSAVIYFFDFVTNILTAKSYYHLESDLTQATSIYECQKMPWYAGLFAGMFPAMVFVLVASQILNGIVFWLSGDVKEGAMKTAFLLPLIHLRRLLLFIKTKKGTMKGVRELSSENIEALYNVLAAALETGPQLFLQFHVFVWSVYFLPDKMDRPKLELMSIAGSLISVSYNCCVAIVTLTNKTTFVAGIAVGIIAVVYSMSAVIVRCIGFELLIALAVDAGGVAWVTHFVKSMSYCIPYLSATAILPALFLWRQLRKHKKLSRLKSLLLCVAFTYMNFVIGPLYILLKTESTYKGKKAKQFQRGLRFAICLFHVVPDVGLAAMVRVKPSWHGCSPCSADDGSSAAPPGQPRFPMTMFSCSALTIYMMFGILVYAVGLVCYHVMEEYADIENKLEVEISDVGVEEWGRHKRRSEEEENVHGSRKKKKRKIVSIFLPTSDSPLLPI